MGVPSRFSLHWALGPCDFIACTRRFLVHQPPDVARKNVPSTGLENRLAEMNNFMAA